MAMRSEDVAEFPGYSLGEMLRKARKDAGMEQEDISQALRVSRPLVSKWERNVSVPNVREYRQFAQATGAAWLLDLSGQNWKSLSPVAHAGQLELGLGIDKPALSLVRC